MDNRPGSAGSDGSGDARRVSSSPPRFESRSAGGIAVRVIPLRRGMSMKAISVTITLATMIISAAVIPYQRVRRPAGPGLLRSFDRFLPLENSGDHSAAISLGDLDGDGSLDIVL